MVTVTIKTPLKTDAQKRAWIDLQAEFMQTWGVEYKSVTFDLLRYSGGYWYAWATAVKPWEATSVLPVRIRAKRAS